jgi:hypothetical protein
MMRSIQGAFDARRFANYDEMHRYLDALSPTEYERLRTAGVVSRVEVSPFSPDAFADRFVADIEAHLRERDLGVASPDAVDPAPTSFRPPGHCRAGGFRRSRCWRASANEGARGTSGSSRCWHRERDRPGRVARGAARIAQHSICRTRSSRTRESGIVETRRIISRLFCCWRSHRSPLPPLQRALPPRSRRYSDGLAPYRNVLLVALLVSHHSRWHLCFAMRWLRSSAPHPWLLARCLP